MTYASRLQGEGVRGLGLALQRQDLCALVLGVFDVKSRVRLTEFFETSISRFERIIEMARYLLQALRSRNCLCFW